MSIISKFAESYHLRLQRRRRRLRALRKRREVTLVKNRSSARRKDDIFLFSTVHNERHRLSYFLDYYRNLGVNHFFFIDNDSDDGTGEFLAAQPDVSLWHSEGSYKRSNFGMDWINNLLRKNAREHWCLIVDVDEFFVYPHCDTRPLRALTDWLDASSIQSFGALLLDMYPTTSLEDQEYLPGQSPFKTLTHFDSGNYTQKLNKKYGNLWIQGGPRQRIFFAENPDQAPALNKIPLVKWSRGNVFVSSTHTLLPRGLNKTFEDWGGEKICGCLLHTKFLPDLAHKAIREETRRQHYAGGREYRAYKAANGKGTILNHAHSKRFEGWRQLEDLGLMSLGGWA
ncbi:glycosyl transferase family 2 [Rhodobacterales bacterium 52_120_T64]|nr:glycosyl transferase family 2 [Rhodobacterales bacterium 52_120_T64]